MLAFSPLLRCELCVAHLIFDFWLLLGGFFGNLHFRMGINFDPIWPWIYEADRFFSQNLTQWLSSRITEWGLWSLTNMLGRERHVIFLWDGEVLPIVADFYWRPQLLLTSFVRILRAHKCYGKAITGREEKSSIAKLTIYNGNGSTCLHCPNRSWFELNVDNCYWWWRGWQFRVDCWESIIDIG